MSKNIIKYEENNEGERERESVKDKSVHEKGRDT